jgi:hypothetical protein
MPRQPNGVYALGPADAPSMFSAAAAREVPARHAPPDAGLVDGVNLDGPAR